MKTGIYEKAYVVIKHWDDLIEDSNLHLVSLTIHSCGFVEITHYWKGEKIPANKRTIIISSNNLSLFLGYGYAN